MTSQKFITIKVILFIFIILLIDQIVKIYIKTHFYIGQSVPIFSWFKISFVENPGMAFGLKLGGGEIGKIILTLFRIVAVAILAIFIRNLIKSGARSGFILTIALVLVGAAGNIIDSMFYGVLFNQSTESQIAQFLPPSGGYAPFLQGYVVDMLYFPIFHFPAWVPIFGGALFFSPVFNIADSVITIAIFLIIFFFLKDLNKSLEKKK
ncbi:MAG: lipoprotein signal peptidase [Paludibacter sp.]|nr:lipoprotein signal peptidase [Paludibacter sp.]